MAEKVLVSISGVSDISGFFSSKMLMFSQQMKVAVIKKIPKTENAVPFLTF